MSETMATQLDRHRSKCHDCDHDSLCGKGVEIQTKQIASALRACYRWAKSRYAQSETGLRSTGGNCFNECNAADQKERLEIQADALGIDHRAIRAEVYG